MKKLVFMLLVLGVVLSLAACKKDARGLNDTDKQLKTSASTESALQQADKPDDKVLALVAFPEGKFGYIDLQGKTVIQPKFDYAYSFSEGLAVVKFGEQVGCIDADGKVVIPYGKFQFVGPFSEGLALAITQQSKLGFINKKGEWAIEPKYPSSENDPYMLPYFLGGKAIVEAGDEGYLEIDKKGKVLRKGRDISDFFGSSDESWLPDGVPKSLEQPVRNGEMQVCALSDGLFSIFKYGEGSEIPSMIFADKDGNIEIDQNFCAPWLDANSGTAASYFNHGLAPAGDMLTSGEIQVGFIDKQGSWAIKPQYSSAASFFNVNKNNSKIWY